jgi:hypothetical protein
MALLFNLGARRGWLINVMPKAALSQGMTRYPSTRRLVGTDSPRLGGTDSPFWTGPTAPVWTCAENLAPTGIRSPERPARNKSLCQLSYPGSMANNQDNKIVMHLTSSVRNILSHFEVHSFAPSLSSLWARESVTNSSDKMRVMLTIDTLTTTVVK